MSRSAFSCSWGGFGIYGAVFLVVILVFEGVVDPAQAADDCPLVSSMRAARHGLQRQWHTQIPLDSSNNRVTHLMLASKSETSPDMLLVQTERSTVFAIDAETGKMLWAKLVGRPDLVSEAVGCNDQMVAVLNGSKLFILNRITGRIMWTRDFPGVPAAGPVLSRYYAFVPFLDGCVAAHPIRRVKNPDEKPLRAASSPFESGVETTETTSAKISSASVLTLAQEKVEPLICPSIYRIETQPVLVQEDEDIERLVWINRNGMYVGIVRDPGVNSGRFLLDYALTTSLVYEAPPAFIPGRFLKPSQEGAAEEEGPFAEKKPVKTDTMPGALVAASTDGKVSAIKVDTGGTLWGYHAGQPVLQPVIAVGTRVYVVSQLGSMLCLDARTGKRKWEAQGVAQFIAQTAGRVYVRDQVGEKISTLRLADGRRIDRMSVSGFTYAVSNDKTDRIFLVTETGLIQSLRQRGIDEPLCHRE